MLLDRVTFCDQLAAQAWVSYIQPPPARSSTAEQVVRYLSRYLTGGPISDRRILSADQRQVTFLAREGKVTGGQRRQVPVTLPTTEFIRRWCLHIQPAQLTKTRYFGGWSGRKRTRYLEYCQELLGSTEFHPAEIDQLEEWGQREDGEPAAEPEQCDSQADPAEAAAPRCPRCQDARMRLVELIPKPPWREVLWHHDSRCPAWYAEQERAAWERYLEEEYGIDDATWRVGMGIESAIWEEPDSKDLEQGPDEPPSPSPDLQRYLPGLEPVRIFWAESF